MKIFFITILSAIALNCFSIDVLKDTTISGNWDLQGQVLNIYGKISGTDTIKNAIIVAQNQYTQIFDTTLRLSNCRAREFSVRWYGANPLNADNYNQLQSSINACINAMKLFIPRGNYKYSKSLKIFNFNPTINSYKACALDIYGEAGIWDDATILTFTDTTGFAVGFQYAKGGSIHNLKIQGKFISPGNNGLPYYNLPEASFTDAAGKCSLTYTGLVIDYDGTKNIGGSTGLKVYDMWVDGFTILYWVSPNGFTLNADILKFTDIRCGNGQVGFRSSEAQEKGNQINNIVAWDNLHTLIAIGAEGRNGQAGNYTIDGGNVAGNVIRLFSINARGWFATHVSNMFAESIAQIGDARTGDGLYNPPIVFDNCNFDFALKQNAGNQTLLTTNSYFVKFNSCMFRYYGVPTDTLNFNAAKATFNNCSFSGKVVGIDTLTMINYPTPRIVNQPFPVAYPTTPVNTIRLSIKNN